MASPDATLLRVIEETLEFRWFAGDSSPVAPPHDTGWRSLPFLVTACCDAPGTLTVVGTVYRGQGNAAWIPAGVRHRCTAEGTGVSHWSCVSFTIAGGIDLCALLETPLTIAGPVAPQIGAINAELAQLAAQPWTLRSAVRRRELGMALLRCGLEHSRWRARGDALATAAQRLAPVLTHLEQHLSRPLRVAELARRAGLSEPRFHVVFRRATGTSPHAHLRRLRLAKAQELLLSSSLSIGEIAERVGHADAFGFSRQFKRQCGMSPSEYRVSLVQAMV